MEANITDTNMKERRAVTGVGTLNTVRAQLTWGINHFISELSYNTLTKRNKRIAVPLPRHPTWSAVTVVPLVSTEYVTLC